MNLDCDEKTLSKIVLIFFHFLFLMCAHSRSQWGALKWPCLHEAPSPHAGCQFGLLFSPPSHSSILPSLTYAHSRTRKWPHECEVLVDMPAVMSQTWPTPSLFRLSRLDIQSSQRGTLKQPRLRTMQRKDADIKRPLRMQHNRTGWPLTWRKAPKFLVSEGWLLWNAKCTTGHCFTRASNKYEKMKWRKNAVAPQFTTRVIVSLSTIQACTIYSKTNFSIHLTWKEYFKHKNTPHPAQG